MRQIAETFRTAGLPDGFRQAAAIVYARQARFKDYGELPSLESVLDALLNLEGKT